jgi:hypothetical protein
MRRGLDKEDVMRRIRYYLAVWLFDLAAQVYPSTKGTLQAHHVGDRWLEWSIDYQRKS